MMVYEFWDMRTSNLIDAFGFKHEALVALRDAVRKQGEHVVEFVMLIEDDVENDNSRIVGMGLQLLNLAKSTA